MEGALLNIVREALPFIGIALGSLLVWAVKALINLMSTKVGVLQDTALREKLTAFAEKAVKDTNQKLVDSLKAGTEDGKLTTEDAVYAASMALTTLKESLMVSGVSLKSIPDALLRVYLEAAVADERKLSAVTGTTGN